MEDTPEFHENNGGHNGKDWHDAAHRFAKGNPGKPVGRCKNRLRDEIKSFLNENWKDFPAWFLALKPKERIQVMLDLLPYAVSRLQSISMSDAQGDDLQQKASIDYTKLSESTLKEILLHTENGQGSND